MWLLRTLIRFRMFRDSKEVNERREAIARMMSAGLKSSSVLLRFKANLPAIMAGEGPLGE